MDFINDYAKELEYPSSFYVLAEDVLTKQDLLQDEYCVVVRLPRLKASDLPATDANYGACVITSPDVRRMSSLMLRNTSFELPNHAFEA
ncbi:hypothetical protein E2553_35170 [Paraburkholderia dipogonis]|uniref:Uncharacterized protein n=1 Tax=Paraburkholderia dipogonis TaxID=1211383 RepID=A0A4Y8MWV8_9BURK|nr:hypothetical protein [Paraburkholderia dipogonis]TFE41882.1 hypothetical protein E2553_35170 [Paraburkholderia dipogonis]